MDAKMPLSIRELSALKFIGDADVGVGFWEDETIRLYRGLGFVISVGKRIKLTAAGMGAISMGMQAFDVSRDQVNVAA